MEEILLSIEEIYLLGSSMRLYFNYDYTSMYLRICVYSHKYRHIFKG